MRLLKALPVLLVVTMFAAAVSSVMPAEAQSAAAPPTNIRAVNGFNPGEVIITWSSSHGATHYRVGCVNMDRDYPKAKASNTRNWRQAFVYVDVDAPNVSQDRPTYTLYGLQEGAYHACTVLANSSRYGQPTWPNAPYWQYLTLADHGGSCPVVAPEPPPITGRPLTIAEISSAVRPGLVHVTALDEEGPTGFGSGFVIRSDGLMITNRHVVDDGENIIARLETPEGALLEFSGRVLGKGILTDLAAVQLNSNRVFNTVDLANSDAVAYGDPVTAWGFPFSGEVGTAPTLTQGIISAPHRIIFDTDFVQTDADINSGNSGGPLIDQYGRVIGVNTLGLLEILPDGSLGNVPGLNFSVASNEIRDRLDTYLAGGPFEATYRNLRYDYRYSINVPRGWYMSDESTEFLTRQFAWFNAYGDERSGIIRTFRISPPFVDPNRELVILTDFFWNGYLPLLLGENWHYVERVSARPVEVGGHNVFRLEYRSRVSEDDCMRSHVALVGISSSFPSKPFGFVTDFAICEEVLATYSRERETILNSFRP